MDCIVSSKLAAIESDIVEMGVKPVSFPVSYFNVIACLVRALLFLSRGEEFAIRARWGDDHFSKEKRIILTVTKMVDCRPGIVKAEKVS